MGRVKFTIHGFQQKKLIEAGLDNNDALVMSVIKDMYASASVESLMINGDRYIWVNQTQLHKFVPILGSLKTVQRIFSKLRKANLLDSHVTHEKKGVRGTFYFIKPTQLFDDLTEYVAEVNTPLLQGGGTNCPRGVGQNDGEGADKMSRDGKTKCPNKDSSTKDSSTSDSKHNRAPADLKLLLERNIDEQLAKDFLVLRKAKRLPLTLSAVEGLEKQAKKANYTLEQVIRTCIDRGWGGFNVNWSGAISTSAVNDFNSQDYGAPVIPEHMRK